MTFYEAALRVLESEGRPLHFLEITQKSISQNLLSHVGKTPEGIVEPGNVFTLELGVATEAGLIGIEEDVLVTEKGCEFLSSFQRDLMLV